GLWAKIQAAHLDPKPIGELDEKEIEQLADLISEHVEPETPPYFKDGVLVFPFGAPAKLRWWERNMTDRERYEFFLRLGVPEDEMRKYMNQRSIDVAKGICDEAGRPNG
ncbi:MAG: hypothetical protein IJU76_08180, partial [Desulfovibrionaceae bacterium]|nr:hypothetical protein [Desulfovibrionaceae bacterium]